MIFYNNFNFITLLNNKKNRKNKILSDTNRYPDNKLTEQHQQTSDKNGEKSDESNEKYVIDKPEGEQKDEYDEDGVKRDDSEKVMRSDKKMTSEKLPPGWEKHEGQLNNTVLVD